MKVYRSEQLRNVAIVAHGGAGKTSLTEAMLFASGATKRMGRVEEGNTVTDYHQEEIKRGVTINATTAPIEWKDHKINLIDTPGYADFIGDVVGAVRAVDSALVVICAVSGVEVQTEVVWNLIEERNLPRVFFINKMDRENASFYRTLEDIQQHFNKRIIPLQLPLGEAEGFEGVVDIIDQKCYRFKDGTVSTGEIPEELADRVEEYREAMVEAAVECDDDLLARYLDGETLAEEEIRSALTQGAIRGEIVPVLCGSAVKNMGVTLLLDALAGYMPKPPGEDLGKKTLAALIFKTLADPFVGKISFVRVFEGVLKPDSVVYNVRKGVEEKVAQLTVMTGKNQQSVPEAQPGDIVAITKLQVSSTGDTLTPKANPQTLEGIEFPEPRYSVAISPKSKGDEDKLSTALARILEEDPTLQLRKSTETKETLLTGIGELHLDITIERLQRKFGVEVEVNTPKIPYRETVRGSATKVEGKHKKQTGGHGQFGHVYIDLAPYPEGDLLFEEKIFGGSVPRQYIPAVEKGIKESMVEGNLAGFPMTQMKITLVDGSYHPVDSSEMAFKIAATMALRKAVDQAKPVLLEPILQVEIVVPDQFMGDIIGDLNGRRGRILGMEPKGREQVIRAHVPQSEMMRYAIDLKSITQGRGSYRYDFHQYEEVPATVSDKIIETAKKSRQE